MNGMWAFLETIPEEKRFNQRLLILGCGSAEFSEDLYKVSFKRFQLVLYIILILRVLSAVT